MHAGYIVDHLNLVLHGLHIVYYLIQHQSLSCNLVIMKGNEAINVL